MDRCSYCDKAKVGQYGPYKYCKDHERTAYLDDQVSQGVYLWDKPERQETYSKKQQGENKHRRGER